MKNLWCLYLSRILNEFFSVCCWVFFCGVFKAAFHRNNLKFFFEKLKLFFIILDFELKNFGHLLENFFGGVVKTALFVSLGTFYIFLKRLCFSCHARMLIDKNSAFCREIFGGAAKTSFVFPWEHFGGKHFPKKFREFFHLFGHWVKSFPLSHGRRS